MKSVFLLYTGGTFGMTANKASGLLCAQPLREVCRHIDWKVDWLDTPKTDEVIELGKVVTSIEAQQIEITLASLPQVLDSSSINHEHWRALARCIVKRHHSYDGFVIIHGTDTMAYSASALAFCCAGLAKPVVVTGAQRPVDRADSDALSNLNDSLLVACQDEIREVVLCFAGSVLRGCRAHKTSTRLERTFVSVNFPELATVRPFVLNQMALSHDSAGDSCRFEALSGSVALCWLHPGMDIENYCRQMQSSDARAFVLCCYGDGHIPDDRQLLETLATLKEQGRAVVSISQCEHRPLAAASYQASELAVSAGLIDGGDATIEATLVKLMWALANCRSTEAVEKAMLSNLRGERTDHTALC